MYKFIYVVLLRYILKLYLCLDSIFYEYFFLKVHPGYGFLSENKEFAKRLVSNTKTFAFFKATYRNLELCFFYNKNFQKVLETAF